MTEFSPLRWILSVLVILVRAISAETDTLPDEVDNSLTAQILREAQWVLKPPFVYILVVVGIFYLITFAVVLLEIKDLFANDFFDDLIHGNNSKKRDILTKPPKVKRYMQRDLLASVQDLNAGRRSSRSGLDQFDLSNRIERDPNDQSRVVIKI
ncbi:uncharacterized protein LOC141854077 [Brevipalpus obovatus]|uniref:uncharacterized protein LOC141854077 n=1 Tax=Brevipalpus obovatus TaxID=246614 RepID=UPI003D9F267A